ncbi:MAG TPA: hypothetical protein VFE98_09100 [Candidatus Bathyarchaeia archaeon]|nr:hypothetical protein [Nitrososphaerales archaeon]HZY94993.1 hypothetical protein [Candidatus Bathyarchaeia archaeon]
MELTQELKTRYAAHIGDDVSYPASCNDLTTACDNMSDFSGEEKEWFSEALPHGNFNSAEEVKKAIGI